MMCPEGALTGKHVAPGLFRGAPRERRKLHPTFERCCVSGARVGWFHATCRRGYIISLTKKEAAAQRRTVSCRSHTAAVPCPRARAPPGREGN